MNAMTPMETAATVSAEIEAIFVGSKPGSLVRVEDAVAGLRDQMAVLNEQLAPFREEAWKSGNISRLPEVACGLEVQIRDIESKLQSARQKLHSEREAYAPLLQAALQPAKKRAGKLVVGSLEQLAEAAAILIEIHRRTAMSGVAHPDGLAVNVNFIRDALTQVARQCGVAA